MAESLLAFVEGVAGYAWTIIPGVLTWWLLDFPELFMSEARKERYLAWTRAKKLYVVSMLIVLGLFVSMFLAFHDERTERLKKEKEITRIQTSCDPNFNWVADAETVEHPVFKKPAIVRRGRVNPLSRQPFFMTIEAHGKGLDGLYIFHQTMHKDPDPRMRQLMPAGIEARALNPFSLVEVVAVVTLPHEVKINEPDFYCAK